VSDFEAALTRLDDYVRGHDDDALVADYEEDLFRRALEGTAPELTFHAGLTAALRDMNARGSLDLWLTARDVERLRAAGVKVVLYELDLENPEPPVIPPGTDLVVTRVPLELDGVRSLEAEVYANDGRLLKRMPDVRFDPAERAVYACCDADLARTSTSVAARTTTKVFVVTDTERRLLVELAPFRV